MRSNEDPTQPKKKKIKKSAGCAAIQTPHKILGDANVTGGKIKRHRKGHQRAKAPGAWTLRAGRGQTQPDTCRHIAGTARTCVSATALGKVAT